MIEDGIKISELTPVITSTNSDLIPIVQSGTTSSITKEDLFEGTETKFNYSTTEQVVGTWIDNKPIYRKTIDFGALPNASTKNVVHNISNLGYLVDIKAVAYNSSNNYFLPLSFVNPFGLNNSVGIYVNNTNIIVITSSDLSVYNSTYVTIEYTKTTD